MSCLLFNIAIKPLAEAIQKSSLHRIQIPNLDEHLIALLFADDTTVFLSEDDNFTNLQKILDKWCITARAKGNLSHATILLYIYIAIEQEAIWILGAWYGYKSPGATTWMNQIQKIDSALEIWDKSNPTMDGCRNVIQMVVSGMTQYLAQVQGMPKEIEKLLTKQIRTFL
ncbi:hypothetical protein L218DRAFT_972780 [Marasmius fiardii PR-910]|nr:hypothetical protein L218DRAFT_972780 [Marasmius fiardii PR-910]